MADCFVLTFRAIARASRLSWISLDCDVTGTLGRVDRVTQFTRFDMTAHLVVPAGEDTDRARHGLERAERNCLISRSLKASIALDASVEIAEPAKLKVPAQLRPCRREDAGQTEHATLASHVWARCSR